MSSFILIHPIVWPQYTNVTDRRTDRQRSDSIRRTVLQTVAQKTVKPDWSIARLRHSGLGHTSHKRRKVVDLPEEVGFGEDSFGVD